MTAEQLKNSILQMAVQGKLVPQDPNDEPASELIKRIREEKEQLIKEGKIKKEKNPSYIFRGEDNIPYEKVGKNEPISIADEVPFEIPESWEWCRCSTLGTMIRGKGIKRSETVKEGFPCVRYGEIYTIRGVVRPAFQMAVDDDLIRKNPFGFQLVDVIVNDSVRREAISREEERKFLKFVKEDKHFSNYYEGIYILFKTGLRISEFCGLTLADIDLENHTLNIDHQLLKRGSIGYYIQETKTTSGTRVLPMTPDVEECLQTIIENRNPPKVEPMVDGHSGFLYFDKDGSIMYSLHWEHYFKHIVQKYNKIYKIQMPKITPHVCRHTYCSNMAKSGMNPKTLQYLMGHSDIGVTLNTYTHLGFEDAKEEVLRLQKVM